MFVFIDFINYCSIKKERWMSDFKSFFEKIIFLQLVCWVQD